MLKRVNDLCNTLCATSQVASEFIAGLQPDMNRLLNRYQSNLAKEDIERICEELEYLNDSGYSKIARDKLRCILSDGFVGAYHELLGYSCLRKMGAAFIPEVSTASGETLSDHGASILDGLFEHRKAYFDIKAFATEPALQQELLDTLRDRFSKENDEHYDYVVMLETQDESVKVLADEILKKKDDIIAALEEKIKAAKPRAKITHQVDGTSYTIILEWRKRVNISMSEMNVYRWAEKNSYTFIQDGKQFTKEWPFILVCTFSNGYRPAFCHVDNQQTMSIAFRSIARRVFIELSTPRYAKELNKPSKIEVTPVHDISKYLSGIFFIDVSNVKLWVYLNPNAHNLLRASQVQQIFGFDYPQFEYFVDEDDFIYDNY